MSTEFPSNVVDSLGNPLEVRHEKVFLLRLFLHLAQALSTEFTKFTFVVHYWKFGELPGRQIDLIQGSDQHILILIADEKVVFPTDQFLSYRVIFRAHGGPKGGDTKLYPFPIGYFNEPGLIDPIPFKDRDIGYFFSGYLNRKRVDFYRQFFPIPLIPGRNFENRNIQELLRRYIEKFRRVRKFQDPESNSLVNFTESFGKGLAPSEYASTLARTKIALCPPGFVMNETIRHWEAMRLGCVVISAPLPPIHFYKDSPIIQLRNWNEMPGILEDLLSDPVRLANLHEATVRWWNDVCCDKAVADYMAEVITRQASN